MAGRKANNSLHRICLLHVQEEIKEKHLYRVFLRKCMKALLLNQNPEKQHPFKTLSYQKCFFPVVIWPSPYKKFYPGPSNLQMECIQIYHPPLKSSLITFREPLPKTIIAFSKKPSEHQKYTQLILRQEMKLMKFSLVNSLARRISNQWIE